MIISKQVTIFSGVDMAASFNSSSIDLLYYREYSATFVFTGSPVGTLKIQGSNDTSDPSSWVDIENSSSSIAAAGSILYEVSEVAVSFIRFVYTRSSGSGTINGKLTAKG